MNTDIRRKILWTILVSLCFLVFLLSRVNLEHFSTIAGKLDIINLLIACSIFILANLIRTFRFHKLDHMNNKLTHWWNINAFYNFITATLPGGAGEAVLLYALKRFSILPITSGLRIIFLSRLMDVFALSSVFFICALLISSVTSYRETALWISGTLFLLSLSGLVPASERFVIRILQKLPRRGAVLEKISEKLGELAKISEEQQRARSFNITMTQSVLMMIATLITMYFVFRSIGINFTPLQSFYCFGIYAVFQIIPIQGIAGIGTQAAWWALALKAAGYQFPDVFALGFVLHGIFYIFIAIIGFSAFMIYLLGSRKRMISDPL